MFACAHDERGFHAFFQTHMPALMNLQMELEAAYKKTLLAKK
jgi:hypothetical protein